MTTTKPKKLSRQLVSYRINAHMAPQHLMLVVRSRCAIGPGFLVDIKRGRIVRKNIPDPLATLAREWGLLKPGETL